MGDPREARAAADETSEEHQGRERCTKTPEDVRSLQGLLDRRHAGTGEHLRSILTDEKRMSAEQVCDLLLGMNLLSLATVTAKAEPRVGAVDGHFHRGHWYFGSFHGSARFRHLRVRPQVSASHVRREELAVVVHGRAKEIDVGAPDHEAFLSQLGDFYGEEWLAEWGGDAAYARIDAQVMFAGYLPAG